MIDKEDYQTNSIDGAEAFERGRSETGEPNPSWIKNRRIKPKKIYLNGDPDCPYPDEDFDLEAMRRING